MDTIRKRNQGITSLRDLHDLPPFFPNSFGGIYMDLRDNLLENLAGLPYMHMHPRICKYPEDTFKSPVLLIAGNPLRSLHGVPRQSFPHFLARFKQREYPMPHSITPDGVKVFYVDRGFDDIGGSIEKRNKEDPPYFLLTPTGIALLDACLLLSPSGPSILNNFHPEVDGGLEWKRALKPLFEFYRLSPPELANLYVAHMSDSAAQNPMSDGLIERLKHEGGFIERQILEDNLPNAQNDPVLNCPHSQLSRRNQF